MKKKRLLNRQGRGADLSKLDSRGRWTATVEGGPHDGHTIVVKEEKHNCGAYGTKVECSCGARWQSAMNGCWQAGHQRQEAGDAELAAMMTMEYRD